MNVPLLFGLLLLILSSVLFISQGPNWIVCLVAALGGWWMAGLLESEQEPDVEVFCIADWSSEQRSNR